MLSIIVFKENLGGVHLVAENILQLPHLLTYDTEIWVDFDQTYFYMDKNNY
jgi:hypothetical protein